MLNLGGLWPSCDCGISEPQGPTLFLTDENAGGLQKKESCLSQCLGREGWRSDKVSEFPISKSVPQVGPYIPPRSWFQDRYPHVTQQQRHTSPSTHAEFVQAAVWSASHQQEARETSETSRDSWEKELDHRCPGQGTAADTMYSPQRINTSQPSATPRISA